MAKFEVRRAFTRETGYEVASRVPSGLKAKALGLEAAPIKHLKSASGF
jgi:hypothetical protein